jgi:hypothetical protein
MKTRPWWLQPDLLTSPGQWARAEVRRRLLHIGLIAVGVLGMVAAFLAFIAVLSAPAAAPIIVASKVLGSAAEAFGPGDGELTGEELAQSGEQSDLICDAAPEADTVAADTEPTVTETPTVEDLTATEDDSPVAPDPIRIGEGGSISRDDADLLLAPLTPGASTLRAHVWFLYRLAGLGDWAAFTIAYEDAGLAVDEESDNAPLRQVQAINSTGADIERYRLTAAAMVEAGQQTGWFTDPYPEYRELVMVEVLSGCLSDAGSDRMVLPPASITTTAPAPDEVAEQVPAEAIPAETVTAGS